MRFPVIGVPLLYALLTIVKILYQIIISWKLIMEMDFNPIFVYINPINRIIKYKCSQILM